MKTKFNYNTQHYFPNNVKIIGILFLVSGLIVFTLGYYLPSILFLFLGMFIFITRYGIEIDIEKKKYTDYLSLFGFKNGQSKEFQTIESIYLNEGMKTTKMHLRGHATTLSKKEYNGYIKFSEDQKIHLLSSEKKNDVEKLLNQMCSDLNITLSDYSKDSK